MRVVFAAVIALVAFRSAAIQLLAAAGAQAPFAFVRSSEAGSDAVLYRQASGQISSESASALLATANATAAKYPLSINAPFAVGMARAKLGSIAEAREAMLLTIGRNPRNRIVRAWLAEQALKDGNYADALSQLNALMRVEPTLVPQISQAMVPFLFAPNMVDAFADAAVDRPPWLPSFIDSARREPRLARQVVALMIEIADRQPEAIETRNVVEVINVAQSRGDLDSGLRLLKAFYPLAFADNGNSVFDPRFLAIEGAAPFMWTFDRESGAVAEGAANGLEVSGRVPPGTRLASQSLILAPGTYALSARGQISPQDSSAFWVLSCEAGDVPVGTASVSDVFAASMGGKPGASFTISPGCGFTRLALVASGQMSGDSPWSVHFVSVVRQ